MNYIKYIKNGLYVHFKVFSELQDRFSKYFLFFFRLMETLFVLFCYICTSLNTRLGGDRLARFPSGAALFLCHFPTKHPYYFLSNLVNLADEYPNAEVRLKTTSPYDIPCTLVFFLELELTIFFSRKATIIFPRAV